MSASGPHALADGRLERIRRYYACLQELTDQLARVDETQLLLHLSRLRGLEEQLRAAGHDGRQRRDLIDRIGREVDSARRVVRPYFAR